MLVHILLMVGIALIVVFITLSVIWLIADMPGAGELTARIALLDMIRIALLVAGGIGGIVALVVAYRKQDLGERAEPREIATHRREESKLFTERFASASEQLGGSSTMVRLAGVYAMSNLADDWIEKRQMCIDVLCAYIRKHYTPPIQPSTPTPPRHHGLVHPKEKRTLRRDELSVAGYPDSNFDAELIRYERESQSFEQAMEQYREEISQFDAKTDRYHQALEERQVRATVFRVIREHLSQDAPIGWYGYSFDFTGSTFDDLDLHDILLDGGQIKLSKSIFYSGELDFTAISLVNAKILLDASVFESGCRIVASRVSFLDSRISFDASVFNRATMSFDRSGFMNSTVSIGASVLNGTQVTFMLSDFKRTLFSLRGSVIDEGSITVSETVDFTNSKVDVDGLTVRDGEVNLDLPLASDSPETAVEGDDN